jgi:hypothetical protein
MCCFKRHTWQLRVGYKVKLGSPKLATAIWNVYLQLAEIEAVSGVTGRLFTTKKSDVFVLECIEIRHAALVKKRQVGVWGEGGSGGCCCGGVLDCGGGLIGVRLGVIVILLELAYARAAFWCARAAFWKPPRDF